MKLSVKKDYNLAVILDQIKEYVSLNEEGNLTFSDFNYREYQRLLSQIIRFPDTAIHVDKMRLVSRAIKSRLKAAKFTPQEFLRDLELELKTSLSLPEEEFLILTSINLDVSDLTSSYWNVFDSEISISLKPFEEKFDSRTDVINTLGHSYSTDSTPAGYSFVTIRLKSRSKREAITRGIDALNFLRAIFCLQMNSINLFFGDSYQPINKIRLGKMHTIHNVCGVGFKYPIHFEVNFRKGTLEKPKYPDIFEKNVSYYLREISKSSFSRKIEQALLRYVDALDEYDNNVAVTKLWGAMESLVANGQMNCDSMPSRIAAQYQDFELTKQLVMHIRDYRNELIHRGVKDDDSIHRAYQLQKFLSDLLSFYISPSHNFKDLDTANKMLDKAALGKERLFEELDSVKKALKFIRADEEE